MHVHALLSLEGVSCPVTLDTYPKPLALDIYVMVLKLNLQNSRKPFKALIISNPPMSHYLIQEPFLIIGNAKIIRFYISSVWNESIITQYIWSQ